VAEIGEIKYIKMVKLTRNLYPNYAEMSAIELVSCRRTWVENTAPNEENKKE
jgi:hypothetical protein